MKYRPVFYGWVVVAATFALLFVGFGALYSFGAFFAAIEAEFQSSRAVVSGIFSYAVCALFLMGVVSGPVADRAGTKIVVACGVIAIAAGLFAASRSSSLMAINLAYTLGIGCGIGLMYVPSISAVQRWFVVRRGFASGIAVTGIGAGTLVAPIVADALLQTLPWRRVFVVFAVVVFIVGLIANRFIEPNPESRGLHPDGMSTGTPLPSAADDAGVAAIVFSRTFVLYYVAQAILSIPIFIPFVHLVPYARDAGVDGAQAVTLLGLIGVGSTCGRFLIGGIADRLGRRFSVTALFAGIVLSYVFWGVADSFGLMMWFAIFYGTCYGGYVALSPALIADYFAGPRLSSVIGLQYTAACYGSLLGPITAGYMFDRTGSYDQALLFGGVCGVLAFGLMLLLPPIRSATVPTSR